MNFAIHWRRSMARVELMFFSPAIEPSDSEDEFIRISNTVDFYVRISTTHVPERSQTVEAIGVVGYSFICRAT